MWWRLSTLAGPLFEEMPLDGTCWKIIGIAITIITALSAVVAILWKANNKLHEELVQETQNGKSVLRELYERMLERARKP